MFYFFLFFALLGTGVGLFPIPEDVIVLSAGAGIFEGIGEAALTFLIVFFGILISDLIIFYIGKKIGKNIFKFKFFSIFLSEQKIEKVKGLFNNHSWKIIFGGRFVVGFRPAIFFTAGMSDVSLFNFIATDFLANLVYAPLFLFFGYRFSYDLDILIRGVSRFYHIMEIIIILIIVSWFIFVLSKKIFNNEKKQTQ